MQSERPLLKVASFIALFRRAARALCCAEGEARLLTKIVQGWPKLRDLVQQFDWKSLLEP